MYKRQTPVFAYAAPKAIPGAVSISLDAETWMDAHSAVELGFADDILKRSSEDDEEKEDLAVAGVPMMFSLSLIHI